MSENTNENIRFPIENDFEKILSGDSLKNAQDFVAFLKANDIMPDNSGDCYCYKGEELFVMHVYEGDTWFIYWDVIDGLEDLLDENLKNFIWDNVMICRGECGCLNWPRGGSKIVFGKEFKSTCSSLVHFSNPGGEALINIKKLVELTRNCIDNRKKAD